jgi:hypothetical protein
LLLRNNQSSIINNHHQSPISHTCFPQKGKEMNGY